jgi:hypothetical protein
VEIIENNSTEEIIKVITQATDEGQRLRSLPLFVGVLAGEEREEIWSYSQRLSVI